MDRAGVTREKRSRKMGIKRKEKQTGTRCLQWIVVVFENQSFIHPLSTGACILMSDISPRRLRLMALSLPDNHWTVLKTRRNCFYSFLTLEAIESIFNVSGRGNSKKSTRRVRSVLCTLSCTCGGVPVHLQAMNGAGLCVSLQIHKPL